MFTKKLIIDHWFSTREPLPKLSGSPNTS